MLHIKKNLIFLFFFFCFEGINQKAPSTFLQIVDKLCPDESSSHSQDNSVEENQQQQDDGEVPSSCNISSLTDNQPDVHNVESSSKISEILPRETESEQSSTIQNENKDSETCKNFTSPDGRKSNSIQSPDNQVSSPQMSTAVGVSSAVVGVSSDAMGVSSAVVGVYSAAVGVSSAAVGVSSTAVGVSSTAAGVSSTAAGVPSTAAGVSSTAVGVSSTADGVSSAAVGVSSTATSLSTNAVIQSTDGVRDFCEQLLTNTSASPSSSCIQPSSSSSMELKCPVKTVAVARLTYTTASTSAAERTTCVASKSDSLKASAAPASVPVQHISNSNLQVLSHTKGTSKSNVPFSLSLPFQPVQCLASTTVPSTNRSYLLLTPTEMQPPSADSSCNQPVPMGVSETINTPSVAPPTNSFLSNIHVVNLQPNNPLQPSSLNTFSLRTVPSAAKWINPLSSGAPSYSNVTVTTTTTPPQATSAIFSPVLSQPSVTNMISSQPTASFVPVANCILQSDQMRIHRGLKTDTVTKGQVRHPISTSSATQMKFQPIAMMKPPAGSVPSKVVTLKLPIICEKDIGKFHISLKLGNKFFPCHTDS